MNDPQPRRASMADAFKGTGAGDAAGLSGILPKRRQAKAATAPTQARAVAATEVEAVTHQAEPSPEPSKKGTSPARKRTDPAKNVVGNVPVYIDAEVLASVRVARRDGLAAGQPERAYDELLVDALSRITLEAIRAELNGTATNAGGLLQGRQRRQRGAGGVQVQLRMNKTQEEQLGDLAEQVGAPSRSAFVNTVYRLAYFKQ